MAMKPPGENSNARSGVARVALVVGPLLFLAVLLFMDLAPGKPAVTATAAVALWMALWWMTEAVPLAATALLPAVLFPALGVVNGKDAANAYFNHIILLFLGGFLVALAMERWDLHRRIALRVLLFFGTRPRRLLLGFMAASAFLSMWISNTATVMMMVPIASAVLLGLDRTMRGERGRRVATGILFGVAYGATLGGIATLVGTPPNLVLARIFEIQFPGAGGIGFASWMLYAVPVSLVFLVLVWCYLSFVFLRGDDAGPGGAEARGAAARESRALLQAEHAALGPMHFEQKVVLVDFVLLALLWIFREDITVGDFTLPGWSRLFPHPDFLNDGTVAAAMALLLFTIPSRSERGSRIMDWETARRLPWDIVLLFGGGFALAGGFEQSGLSAWMGVRLEAAQGLHPIFIVALISLVITFLTELTSNTATAQILLPVLASLSLSIGVNPLLLMLPGTLSCSLAFMLPVATPPNAIIFGTGRLRASDMAKTGFVLNLAGVLIVTLGTWWIARGVFGIDLAQFPAWAVK